jgi:hypothetical protein
VGGSLPAAGGAPAAAAVAKASETATGNALAIETLSAPADVCVDQTAAADLSALEMLGLTYTFRTMEAGLSPL